MIDNRQEEYDNGLKTFPISPLIVADTIKFTGSKTFEKYNSIYTPTGSINGDKTHGIDSIFLSPLEVAYCKLWVQVEEGLA